MARATSALRVRAMCFMGGSFVVGRRRGTRADWETPQTKINSRPRSNSAPTGKHSLGLPKRTAGRLLSGTGPRDDRSSVSSILVQPLLPGFVVERPAEEALDQLRRRLRSARRQHAIAILSRDARSQQIVGVEVREQILRDH